MRSLKHPRTYEPLVRLLAESNHPATGRSVFPTMRELLCFAAVLGFAVGKRTPLIGAVEEIDGRIFENSDQAIDLVYVIALADSKNSEILHPDKEDEMIQTFEEYAATGLSTIDDWLKERPDDVYGNDAIVAALRKYGYLASANTAVSIQPGDVSF